ncbi:MAG: PrpF family protein [Alphaproteobacteria bacterium]|nr:MAG: PrpF family protein [Alphaproteobacteria bacterium]
MKQLRLRAVFMRGGTSNAIMLRTGDLPEDRALWPALFLAAMGSPDPNGRQLDGMGGGISSLSKVCVIGPPSRPDADIDYTFIQIMVTDAAVDTSGNCGNMSSAVGPFAVDEGIIPRPEGKDAVVRIHNTNTGKIIVSRFTMDGELAAVDGDFALPGVAGTGAPVRLEFLDPGGSGSAGLLPTGKVVDELEAPGIEPILVSMVDAALPAVFLDAAALGAEGTELPSEMDGDRGLMDKLETIRLAASVRMGIAATPAAAAKIPHIPKVALITGPKDAKTLAGETIIGDDMDVTVRMISIGNTHRAVPVTGSLCLAVAARIEGSVVNALARPLATGTDIRIANPSGVITVAAELRKDGEDWVAEHAVLYRTQRRLMEGTLLVSAAKVEAAEKRAAPVITAA